MAFRLFRLRVALLGGSFRGSFGKGLRAALLYAVLAAAAVVLAFAPTVLVADAHERSVVDLIIGTAILFGVFIVPFFENRRMLEPRQFAQYPAESGSVAGSLLLSTVLTWPFFLLVIWLAVLVTTRPEWHDPAWIAPVACVLAALFAVASVRVTSLISRLLAGQRFAGALRTAGVVLIVAMLPLAVFVGATIFAPGGFETADQAAETLALTPFGAPFAAIQAAAAGDSQGALLELGILAAAIVVLLAIWFPLVAVSNQHIERPLSPGIARSGLGWFERFSARPAQVIAARQLTYWARDPRYRVALFAIPLAPIFMMLAFWVAGAPLTWLALVPLPVILLLLGWSQHNDVAMDSTAIWEHVASGTRGRSDRAGRLAPVLMIGVPLAVIGSSITVTIVGDWRILPAVVGMNLGVLLVACAVSSIFSVLTPYPATRPGDSPFVQPQWSGSGSGLAQTIAMILALALAAPPVWFAITAIIDVEFASNMWALGFGIGYGFVVLVLGVLIGGWLFDRSGPELIAVTQVFD
ncbi:hypothetical protein ACFWHR_07025 [Leucobacter sp. NPDC058333]|uniref:hypothetical protein n=1 Tax=Leucobacter sp. NPDC058333 TaxID=3346450 RepID=UPI003653A7A4